MGRAWNRSATARRSARPRRQLGRAALLVVASSACGAQPALDDLGRVAGPADFSFSVDGPIVVNGPPWDCISAGTECSSPEANMGGTLLLVDECVLVQGYDSRPDSPSAVIFPFGSRWDDGTSAVVGLGSRPIAIGDEIDGFNLSVPVDGQDPYDLPDLPDEARRCAGVAGDGSVWMVTPWVQDGPLPTMPPGPDGTTAPTG